MKKSDNNFLKNFGIKKDKMETTFDFSQLSLIIPAFAVSIFAVLVFVFGFKKPNQLPEFDKNINLTESVTKRKKEKHVAASNGDVKKSQPKKQTSEPKKKAVVAAAEKPKKVVEQAPTPKASNKPDFAQLKAQKRQEIKEYKESQSDDGWTVVKPKKGAKVEEINVQALVEAAKAAVTATNDKNGKKSNKKEKSNEKEIKNRVNNELKKEENIKAVIEEIQGNLKKKINKKNNKNHLQQK